MHPTAENDPVTAGGLKCTMGGYIDCIFPLPVISVAAKPIIIRYLNIGNDTKSPHATKIDVAISITVLSTFMENLLTFGYKK